MMLACKWPNKEWTVNAFNVERCWRIAGVRVVIAAHQYHFQIRVRGAPLCDCQQGAFVPPSARVQQVANNHDSRGGGFVEHCGEAFEITRGDAWRKWNPFRAKGGGFAPVQIGHDQRRQTRQVQRAKRGELYGFARDFQFVHVAINVMQKVAEW